MISIVLPVPNDLKSSLPSAMLTLIFLKRRDHAVVWRSEDIWVSQTQLTGFPLMKGMWAALFCKRVGIKMPLSLRRLMIVSEMLCV